MALVRFKFFLNSDGACQKTILGCCVVDTCRVIREEWVIFDMQSSIPRSVPYQCKSPGYATEPD